MCGSPSSLRCKTMLSLNPSEASKDATVVQCYFQKYHIPFDKCFRTFVLFLLLMAQSNKTLSILLTLLIPSSELQLCHLIADRKQSPTPNIVDLLTTRHIYSSVIPRLGSSPLRPVCRTMSWCATAAMCFDFVSDVCSVPVVFTTFRRQCYTCTFNTDPVMMFLKDTAVFLSRLSDTTG